MTDVDLARRVELLGTDEPEPVRAVVEDLRQRGSPADWDRLVSGFVCESGTLQQSARPGPLRCSDVAHVPARRLTIATLVAAAPETSGAASLRPGITELTVAGARPYDAYYRPMGTTDSTVDVAALAGLAALRQLSIEHADTLRGLDEVLAAGRLVTLTLKNVVLSGLDLTPLADLTTLRLSELSGFARLTGLPRSLEDLKLHDVPRTARVDLGGATGLRRLVVIRGPLPVPATALARLCELEYHTTATAQDDVHAWLPALTSVESATVYGLDSVASLAALSGLRRLTLGYGRRPYDLGSLALPHLTTLALEWTDALTTVDGRAGALPALRTLTVKGTPQLVGLDGLEVASGLTSVAVSGVAVRDVGALAQLPELRTLRLRTPALSDLSPLAGLTRLRQLDLTGCHHLRDLTPLAGLALDRLVVSQTRLGRTAIPSALHPVVHPPSAVAPRPSRAAAPVPAPVPPPDDAKSTFTALKRMLQSREEARTALERLRTLDDPAVFEALLSGCEPATRPTAQAYGRYGRLWAGTRVAADLPAADDMVRPNRFLGYRVPRPYREAAIHTLVAYAPTGSPTAERLRGTLRSVVVDGRGPDGREHPVDLRPLAALPNLEHLGLVGVSELVDRPALGDAARLRTLVVRSEHGLDLRGVSAPSVTTLVVGAHWIEAMSLGGFPGVRDLYAYSFSDIERVDGGLPGLTGATLAGRGIGALAMRLAPSPLEWLTLTYYQGPPSLLGAFTHTRSLTSLEVRYSTLGDLAAVAALTSLRDVTLHMVEASGAGALARLPHLERLALAGATLTAADVAALAEAPALRELRLADAVRIEGRLPERLERICHRGRATRP